MLRRARSRADASECEGAAALRELREDEGAERFLRRGGPAFDGAGHGDLRRHDAGGLGMLEAEALDIGVVSAIAGPAALEVTFTGDGGHAGGLMMRGRCGRVGGRGACMQLRALPAAQRLAQPWRGLACSAAATCCRQRA